MVYSTKKGDEKFKLYCDSLPDFHRVNLDHIWLHLKISCNSTRRENKIDFNFDDKSNCVFSAIIYSRDSKHSVIINIFIVNNVLTIRKHNSHVATFNYDDVFCRFEYENSGDFRTKLLANNCVGKLEDIIRSSARGLDRSDFFND